MFKHNVKFNRIDPLGAGLREIIKAQQENPESRIDLFDRPTGEELQDYLKSLIATEVGGTALMNFETQE